MIGDKRSFRVALMADRYVNPPPGGIDGLAIAERAGWGVIQLPAAEYTPEISGPMLVEVAEHVEEFHRRGYDLVLIGEPDGAALALSRLDVPLPDAIVPETSEQLLSYLQARPEPPAARLLP